MAVVGAVAIGAVATAPTAGAAPPAATSADCRRSSCTFTRTGQSLFRVPAGVALLQVDVVGAGGDGPGQAVEVKGSVVLPPHETSLEVVVGGKDTLGGTSSEILTSTDTTPEVLVAARGKQVGKLPGRKKAGTGSRRLVTAPQPASAPEPASTLVPLDGSVGLAKGRARVMISWRSPSLPAAVTSSRAPSLPVGTASTFVVRVSSSVAPRLTERGALPVGLDFFDQGNGTATIEGIPVVGGVYPLDVTVTTGAAPPVTERLVLTVGGTRVVARPQSSEGGLPRG